MTEGKRKRLSMLDSLAAAGAASPPASMMSSNRALRSARDAVDSHHVWELDPSVVIDNRMADRLDPGDVADLRDAIEANGQAVPILVRRHPTDSDRYLLVYGRRRLEAIRQSDKVTKVRALVASLDDDAAVRSQISENMARRDLSFIEKAVFAQQLVENGFGNQSQVAEVLTVSKSAISMALAVVDAIGIDLITAIGAAHGVGRPRWDALARAIEGTGANSERLIQIAEDSHKQASVAAVIDSEGGSNEDPSVLAFEAVAKAANFSPPAPKPVSAPKRPSAQTLRINGNRIGAVRRTSKGLNIELDEGAFTDWLETEAPQVIKELHARWQKRSED